MCVRLSVGIKVQYIQVYKHRHTYGDIHSRNPICDYPEILQQQLSPTNPSFSIFQLLALITVKM